MNFSCWVRAAMSRAASSRSVYIVLLLIARSLPAQTGYYNLDAGRPTRVEDAIPTELREIELQFLPVRAERVGDGTERIRFEPKIAYGAFSRTEIEVRAPIMDLRANSSPETIGLASIGVGALHALNTETSTLPALALAGEMVFPAGSLSAPIGSYSLKALATKTLPFARLHLNVGGGTWSARLQSASGSTGTLCGNAPGVPPCLIPDVPCDLVPAPLASPHDGPAFSCVAAASSATTAAAAGAQRSTGAHWTAGLGIDHTLPMISTLLAGDIVVDRFVGLYPLDDWTAEAGVRRQLTPELILDAGVSRRFAGTTQSTSVVFGLSYGAPLRALFH
jgi:hypothetical protein